MEGVHGDVDEALNIGPGGGAGHQYRIVKGVEGGLDYHVGQGKHHTLKAGGQADLQDLEHSPLFQSQPFQVQMEGTLLLYHAPYHQGGGDILGNDGGQRHSGHIHLQGNHKNQIQEHIDHAGEGEKIQRPLRVPLGPQDGCAEIVDQVGRHAQEIDAQVHGGQVDDIRGGGGPLQQLADHHHTENHHAHAAD